MGAVVARQPAIRLQPIGSRLVLDIKLDPSGGDDHVFKTRLVGKGFTQRPGIDFYDTYSPVGHRQSFRQLLSLAAVQDWEVEAVDIRTAFLHGDLEETMYMKLPPEVASRYGNKNIALLKKALYGLKQAGRCWNDKLDAWLQTQGWTSSDDDSCVYVLRRGDTVEMLLYIHVDDSAIAGPSLSQINAFIDTLDTHFPCKRQGALKHFLGMEVTRDRRQNTLWITQTMYTNRILTRFNLFECRPHSVPLSPSVTKELVQPSDSDFHAARHLPYRELTGALQYLSTMTRPDIAFAVNRLSSFNAKWSARLFEICKGILRYVAGMRNLGLQLGRTKQGLLAFSDSDFNACADTYKSTTGWIVQLAGGTIAWRSRKQTIIAHSTAEAEYIAIDDVARDLVWECRALSILGQPQYESAPTHLNVDNKAAIALARNKISHDSTKHIHYRFHYIRSLIRDKLLTLDYIDTHANTADILTKALARDLFATHRDGLGLSTPVLPVGESVGGKSG